MPSSKALRLALAALFGFAVVYVVFVHTGVGHDVDQAALIALALTRALPQVIPDQPSFPSGDATLAMAVACALVLIAAPGRRRTATAVAGAFAIVVGVALVALDWHRPSEVAGGYLLAVSLACALASLASRSLRRAAPRLNPLTGWGLPARLWPPSSRPCSSRGPGCRASSTSSTMPSAWATGSPSLLPRRSWRCSPSLCWPRWPGR